MTLEDKFKKQLGEMSFTITVLQHQLEETANELNSLKEEKTSARSAKSKES